ncbi:MAG: alpha/beta hydrolase [Kiritimatiellia bacterium]|jgi:pimeloyl-ACP methyl ester carboxylesterase|nr:alpha/beta hydrolase [Kiritimatiellia bacterium]
MLYGLAFLTVLWLAVNLLHTGWVETRRFLWERRITRDPEGLLPGAAAFQVGEGPIALLFIHGFADTPCVWRRFADRLAATGDFSCRVLRLAGSAEPAARSKRVSLELWRAQLSDELIRLGEHHDRIWVVGHSMGGALALDAALRHPGAVEGVAVFAPLVEVSRARAPMLAPGVWFALARVALCLSPTFESPFSAEGVAADDPGFTYTRDRFIPFSVYRSLFRLVRSNRKASGRLTQPVFAVTANRDAVVDTPAALRWLAECRGPKRILDLPDVGHVIPLANGWRELADDFAAFLRSHKLPELPELPVVSDSSDGSDLSDFRAR